MKIEKPQQQDVVMLYTMIMSVTLLALRVYLHTFGTRKKNLD